MRLHPQAHVGVDNSFAHGEHTLQELTGWSVDAETIRRLCHAEAVEHRKTKSRQLDVAGSFKKASGDWELQIDAGKVNTEAGWRDVKVATFAVREPADPRTSEEYDRPTCRNPRSSRDRLDRDGRLVRSAVQGGGGIRRLPDAAELTVLGDGAEWIWNLAGERFAGAEQTLDVECLNPC